MPRVANALLKICIACNCMHKWWWPMPPNPKHGGMASSLMPFCWTRPAPHRALCADIPMCHGLRRETDSGRIGSRKQQAQLLTTLWPLLKPGGRLLYCTCSVFKMEGELPKSKRFFNTTPRPVYCPVAGAIKAAKQHGSSRSRRQSSRVITMVSYYALLEKTLPMSRLKPNQGHWWRVRAHFACCNPSAHLSMVTTGRGPVHAIG